MGNISNAARLLARSLGQSAQSLMDLRAVFGLELHSNSKRNHRELPGAFWGKFNCGCCGGSLESGSAAALRLPVFLMPRQTPGGALSVRGPVRSKPCRSAPPTPLPGSAGNPAPVAEAYQIP